MTDRLPIYEVEAQILARLCEHRRLILSAPTGSGKSTQVPQMLLRAGLLDRGQAVILQPRRIAARLLASRVASELSVPLGREVGYQVRFENVVSDATKIRFVTEGILLRQMIAQPKLPGISALLFDEFHERHLYGDVTLARALDLQERERPDLLIVVMSATLDAELLANYLKPCSTVSSDGRVHPVAVEYAGGTAPVWDLAAEAFARHAGDGDALIFMPGSYEIHRTLDAIRARPEARGRLLLPLHGELAPRDQDAAVARYDKPKIIVATNVAETSITIDGVTLVIDSGLARIARYDPNRGINTLLVEKISRASAEQRAGRAGRTAPGRCVRLWTEREQSGRPARELPEIRRLDLSEVVLTLKDAGVADLGTFRWLEPPAEKALASALALLADLGALKDGAITPLGRRMLAFPVHPRYSRLLLAAQEYGCVRDAALVAALTQGRDLLLRGADREGLSDFDALARAWKLAARSDFRVEACQAAGIHAVTARQVGPLFEQFLRLAGGDRAGAAKPDALAKCILLGFSDRVARRLDEGTLRCEVVHGRRGTLARESVVATAPLLVAAEMREVEGKNVDTILSLATPIEPAWLEELFPGDMNTRLHAEYDSAAGRVIAEEQRCFRDLALTRKRVEPPPSGEAARLLAAEVLAGRIQLKRWDDAVDQWILRLDLLSTHCPELGIAPIGESDRRTIMEQLCDGAVTAKDVRDRPVLPVVKSWLNGSKQALVEKHAPERLDLPNGRHPKLVYAPDGPPFIALRIQELYDVPQVPRIALGRVSPLVHILAPSQRPVQITQDLAGFWRDHYPKLKKELQRKYPRHEWR